MNRYLFIIVSLLIHHLNLFGQPLDSNKQILVTGGAGFLGSHLCERLIKEGHKVYCLDNLFTGSKENIKHLSEHPNFAFFEDDVINPKEFYIQFDEIYNLACPASPIHYQEDPIKTLKTNVFGALFVLELAKQTGATVFQASTSEIYGDPLIHPQQENYWGNVNPIGIRACYDEGKRCAETLFFDYHRMYGVKIKVARIFNTYGPRMSKEDGRVVSNFITQALENKPLFMHGSGEQTRSFCYVDDLIDAIFLFMKTPEKVTGPINLGNPEEYTIFELANKIIDLTDSTSSIAFHPLPQDDPKKRRPDITLASDLLNWFPKVPLEDGLKNTILFFQNELKKEKK